VNKRSLARFVPGLRRTADALDRYEAELAQASELTLTLTSHVDHLSAEIERLRSERETVSADNDRLRRFLNELAFSPDACEGSDGGWPLPSPTLRFLVAGSDDLEVFLRLGRAGAELVQEMPARQGRPLADLGRVLDFGCGCGRTVRHLADTGAEIHGCDPNPHAVHWCERHLPFGSYAVTGLAPPLPYPDEHFGLVFAFSVFTHLSLELQEAWMTELRRIVAPAGYLLLTTHGDACIGVLDEAERAHYEAGHGVVRLGERAGANECAAFHPRRYVEHVLAQGWTIAEHAPAGAKGNPPQDAYLLRRDA
jgi:SAM-dependent methyltransferase